VRSQVAAAAASGANTLICGRRGAGRGHVARAVHYRAAGDADVALVPVDCEVAGDDMLRRALDAVRDTTGDTRQRPTLLLENLDRLGESQQSQLMAALRQNAVPARIIATCSEDTFTHSRAGGFIPPGRGIGGSRRLAAETTTAAPIGANDLVDGTRSMPATLDSALCDAVSTIAICVPRLSERLEDLPILAQVFLEASNRNSGKQVGSVRSEAIDLLALYSWPGELDELREVITAAHRSCNTHEITPADLPAVIHHASKSASRARRQPERIVLDELLANIEKEAIVRALAQAGGNKTEAAALLGMTRPRLYRRLVQLGLAGPEFIERDPNDEST
jgi:DNA-binding NtrC family response regulator